MSELRIFTLPRFKGFTIMNKKKITIFLGTFPLLVILAVAFAVMNKRDALPKAERSEGLRGELGIDKNINEKNIDDYLGREDSVYYDMRMLVDSVRYEEIGGDSYLSGFISGFEVIPYPYLATVTGLPENVGEPYMGPTLFTITEEGEYIANYEEAMEILEYFFPKDKKIFLMCGGGGYAGMTKELLIAHGWNGDLIYNIGGYWYYTGEHKVEVKRVNTDGTIAYDFWKIPYHEICFDDLTEVR